MPKNSEILSKASRAAGAALRRGGKATLWVAKTGKEATLKAAAAYGSQSKVKKAVIIAGGLFLTGTATAYAATESLAESVIEGGSVIASAAGIVGINYACDKAKQHMDRKKAERTEQVEQAEEARQTAAE